MSSRITFMLEEFQRKREKRGQKTYLKKQWLKTSLTWRRKQTSRSKKHREF